MEWFETVNPFTRLPWQHWFPVVTSATSISQSAPRIEHSRRAVGRAWLHQSAEPYCAVSATCFPPRSKRLAEVETYENGKSISDTLAQVRSLPEWFYYYGGLIDKIEGRVIPVDQEQIFNYTKYEPLGVVVAITPWNSPLMLTCWKLAPLLAAGNTVVIKPSNHAFSFNY